MYRQWDSLDAGSARRKASNHIHDNINRINENTFMPPVEFEPMAPIIEQTKTVPVLDREATLIGSMSNKFFD
jgi:hypothetical protein